METLKKPDMQPINTVDDLRAINDAVIDEKSAGPIWYRGILENEFYFVAPMQGSFFDLRSIDNLQIPLDKVEVIGERRVGFMAAPRVITCTDSLEEVRNSYFVDFFYLQLKLSKRGLRA